MYLQYHNVTVLGLHRDCLSRPAVHGAVRHMNPHGSVMNWMVFKRPEGFLHIWSEIIAIWGGSHWPWGSVPKVYRTQYWRVRKRPVTRVLKISRDYRSGACKRPLRKAAVVRPRATSLHLSRTIVVASGNFSGRYGARVVPEEFFPSPLGLFVDPVQNDWLGGRRRVVVP